MVVLHVFEGNLYKQHHYTQRVVVHNPGECAFYVSGDVVFCWHARKRTLQAIALESFEAALTQTISRGTQSTTSAYMRKAALS